MVKDLKNSFKTSAGGHAVKQTFQILQFQLHIHCFVRLVSLSLWPVGGSLPLSLEIKTDKLILSQVVQALNIV